MSAGSVRQTSLVAVRQVANHTKVTVKVIPTFCTIFNDKSAVFVTLLYRISVHAVTHNAVRHIASACCCTSDVINVLSYALLQYESTWSVHQSVRQCKRHGWVLKTSQYVVCE